MSWVAVAVGGASLVGGVVASKSQSKAADKAANAQLSAADKQAQVQWDMYNQSRQDQLPAMDVGRNAMYEAFGYTPQTQTYYPPGTSPSGQANVMKNALGSNTASVGAAVQPGQQFVGGSLQPNAVVGTPAQAVAPTAAAPAAQPAAPPPDMTGWNSLQKAIYAAKGNVPGTSIVGNPKGTQAEGEFVAAPLAPQSPGAVAPGQGTVSQQQGQGQAGNNMQQGGSPVESYAGVTKTGPGVDPTGGAQKYLDLLMALDPESITGGSQKYVDQLEGLNPNIGVDATGGAQEYLDQLKNLKFELNLNDPIYQWRKDQVEKSINQAAAARGMYNSRPTINALSDANMALQSNELDRQFTQNYMAERDRLGQAYEMATGLGSTRYGQASDNYMRNYSQLSDLYTMARDIGATNYGAKSAKYATGFDASMKLGQTDYLKLLDAIKIGQGASSAAGQNAMITGSNLSDIYGNAGNAMASNALYKGNNTAQTISGITNSGINALAAYNLFKK